MLTGTLPVTAISVTEAAHLAGVSRRTAYRMVADGSWPSVRIRSRVVVPLVGLQQWIETNTTGGAR